MSRNTTTTLQAFVLYRPLEGNYVGSFRDGAVAGVSHFHEAMKFDTISDVLRMLRAQPSVAAVAQETVEIHKLVRTTTTSVTHETRATRLGYDTADPKGD